MRISVLVTVPPEDRTGSLAAQGFLSRARSDGDEVLRVFFHGEGVRQAACPPGALRDGWTVLAREGLELVACGTAARRREILETSLAPGFRLGGLGLFIEAALEADRFVQFAP